MDKSLLLKRINIALRIGGLLPYKSDKSNIWFNLHRIYCHVSSIYFYIFVLTQALELINLFRGDKFVVLELLNILGVFLLYSIAIIKLKVIRSKTMGDLYDEVYEQEELILNSKEDGAKIIYRRYVWFCYIMCKYFLIMAFACVMPFFVTPFVENLLNPMEEFYIVTNDTKIYKARPLPFINWLPFDKYKYYKTTYISHILAGTFGGTITAVCDITFYGMTLYAVAQLEILQHLFKNFRETAINFRTERNYNNEYSDVFVIKCLIVLHKKIIRYTERLNESMNALMLLDIFSTTLQIAVLGFQVIVIGGDWRLYQVFIYIGTMLTQMSLFYMFANDITLESQRIALAIWESDWEDVSLNNKKTLVIIMMRAQKPICLNVGPFYPMSRSTILSIIRASYSYLALLKQVYG